MGRSQTDKGPWVLLERQVLQEGSTTTYLKIGKKEDLPDDISVGWRQVAGTGEFGSWEKAEEAAGKYAEQLGLRPGWYRK